MGRIKVGDIAPNFKANTINGKSVELYSFKNKKVWLSFYRYAGCPLCNTVFSAIASKVEDLKKMGIVYVALFESDPKMFSDKFIESYTGNCFVVADPKQEIYSLYHIEKSIFATVHPFSIKMLAQALANGHTQPIPDTSINRLPAHFLINEKSVVHSAYYGSHAADHIKWDTVINFAKK